MMGEQNTNPIIPVTSPPQQQCTQGRTASMRPLEFTDSMADNWKLWVQKFKIFLLAKDLEGVSDERKIALLLHNMGDKGIEIFNSLNLEHDKKHKYVDVLEKFNSYFIPKVNITMQRHKFFTRTQGTTETFDDFFTDLQNKSMSCNFDNKREELVRDVIVIGLASSAMKERLLRTDDLTLQKTVTMCRAAELSQKQITELTNDVATTSMLNVNTSPPLPVAVNNVNTSKPTNFRARKCYRCGNNWDRTHKCPAMGCKCQKCGIPNHFAKVCRNKQVATINEEQAGEDSEKNYFVGSIGCDYECIAKNVTPAAQLKQRMALVEEAGAGAAADDPEALLNEWLGELTVLTAGLNSSSETGSALRPLEIVAPRIDTYRFSMANLEETQDADLDAILGELCALDSEYDEEISRVSSGYSSSSKERDGEGCSQRQECKESCDGASVARTDSPDNDSAFSDTVSMLSSESSASSSASAKCKAMKLNLHQDQKNASFQQKADKIKLALERMREANIKKLFIKAFSTDGSSKSLLVDEKMSCGYVTRLLADKNHVSMEPKWAVVEHLPDLHMERVYEDHEMLVDNLMLWTRESKNKILFAERSDKISLFQTPEKFLLSEDDRGWSSEHDEHSRQVILEEFFGQSGAASTAPSVSGHPVPPMEGPLYLKSDAKKGWKKYHFVLRPSGLYYSPKDKVKTLKELVCLATFDTNEVYLGLNWKKKYKSPTDYCFAIKHPRLQQPKSVKFIKFLCADDQRTLERWVTAMRIAKHGRQLLENHRSLVEELTQEDLDHLAHARSCSITSIPTKSGGPAPAASSPAQSSSHASGANSDISSGRHSRASSSSSSGCLSDGGTASESAFDCEFPMGTIKRKPSMKPNIPLTWMTRQLKEMAEKEAEEGDAGDSGTLTRTPRGARDDSTLKRHHTINISDRSESAIYGRTTVRDEPASPCYGIYESIARDAAPAGSLAAGDGASSLYGYASIYETAPRAPATEDLPPPPPTDEPDAMFSSTLSLDSLPPPPPPPLDTMEDLSGSQLSLPPPPPEHTIDTQPGRVHDIVNQLTSHQIEQTARTVLSRANSRNSDLSRSFPRQPSLDSVSSGTSRTSSIHSDKSIYGQQNVAYGACLAELQTKKMSNGSPSIQKKILAEPAKERTGSIKKVIFADDVPTCTDSAKKNKKITFNLKDPPPSSPRKPPPPKRNESTRLSSPKKLADSNSNPPKEFLKDLQRVMRKKWQVAQKCKLEPATTPHEVLGFREYPLSEDYKETSVSMWVQEHYGSGVEDPFYENVFGREAGAAPRREEPAPVKKRPPPAPPRRSDSTHLSSHPLPPAHAVHPTA